MSDAKQVGVTEAINYYNKNKWQIRFSDFPNLTGSELKLHVFNNYVQNIVIPDISEDMMTSIYLHSKQDHPGSKGSRDLQTITMLFKIDEEMKNWFAMYCLLFKTRHGINSGKTEMGEELLRMNRIETIQVLHLNNNGKIISKMKFNRCFLTNISSLELVMGQSEEATFTATFDVEDIDIMPITDDDEVISED